MSADPNEIHQMLKNYHIKPDEHLVYCAFNNGRFVCCTERKKSVSSDDFLIIGNTVTKEKYLRLISYDKAQNTYAMIAYAMNITDYIRCDSSYSYSANTYFGFDLNIIFICQKKLISKLKDSYGKIVETNKTKRKMGAFEQVTLFATEKTRELLDSIIKQKNR